MNRKGNIEIVQSTDNFPNMKLSTICVEKHREMAGEKSRNFTSTKMYVNPRFLQNNYHSSIYGNSMQAVNLVTVKPSVYVNPKLVAQIMKTNSLVTASDHSTDREIQNIDIDRKLEMVNRNSNKYVYCSKTKIIKQSATMNTEEFATKVVPKKSSPVCSQTGTLMALSRTKLVRAPIKQRRNSYQRSKNVSSQPNNTPKVNGRRSSINSAMIRVSNTKLVRVPLKQKKNNMQETLSNSSLVPQTSNMPLISLSKTKMIRSSIKPRRSSLSNKLPKRTVQSSVGTKFASRQLEPRNLVSITRTKLIRSPAKARSNSESNTPRQRKSSKSCVDNARVRRNSVKTPNVVIKAAKAVRSKYKIIRSPVLRNNSINSTINRQTRYKIDRRLNKTLRGMRSFKKYSLQYSDRQKSKHHNYKKSTFLFTPMKSWNRTWKKSLSPRKVLVVNKKLMRIGRNPCLGNRNEKRHNDQNLCLVQIGGVLYKTSKMKLTRHNSKFKSQDVNPQHQNSKKHRLSSSLIVSVRGNKFLMDPTAKTLVKVQAHSESNNTSPVKRIDIGGVTFVQKSQNVLMRTNTHTARTFVSQAKQKSIMMLTNKLRKSNQPCIFYHRFGKCSRKEKGTCPRIHDPKQVAICRKFLQGCCEMNCTLSHDVGPEKMPTCKYFLEGCCVRENCPYLHVKVNEKAAICEKFLQGYCPDGKECRMRHTSLCPEFDRTGKCSKGKYCPYPHQTLTRKRTVSSKKHIVTEKKECKISERKRYYESDKPASVQDKQEENASDKSTVKVGSDFEAKRLKLLKKVNDMKRAWLIAQSGTEGDQPSTSDIQYEANYEPEMKRPKIGTLPSYIPLTSDSQ